jgi:cytoskeleton protein RodZ
MNEITKPDEAVPVRDLGSRLRAARESKGLTLEELADQMCLLPSVVRDLEKEDYTKFDALIYVTGYLRLYSRLVQVDEREILSLFYKNPINRTDKVIVENKLSISSRLRISPLLFMVVLVTLALLIGLLYLGQ